MKNGVNGNYYLSHIWQHKDSLSGLESLENMLSCPTLLGDAHTESQPLTYVEKKLIFKASDLNPGRSVNLGCISSFPSKAAAVIPSS